MIVEQTSPTNVVTRAVLIPIAMSDMASCTFLISFTSKPVNAVFNMIRKPATVPIIVS